MEQAVKKFIDATDLTFIPSERMKIHIFKVKPTDKAMMELIETGFFDGNEFIIRETTTKNGYGHWGEHTYTIIRKDGSSWSWEIGSNRTPYMSEGDMRRMMIIDRAMEILLN